MELLGPTLQSLFEKCEKKFSLKTVLLIADQSIKRLEQLHNKGYIHRDIKPENFLIGDHKNSNTIYLIDFGLSREFNNSITGRHISYLEAKKFIGTARYASVNTHAGIEQSRRDDLESLGYLFVYLLKGKLPWENIPAETKKEKYERIYKMKVIVPITKLCAGLPKEFLNYMNYCKELKFNERPDYMELLRGFKELFFQKGFLNDHVFDWTLLNTHQEISVNDIVVTKSNFKVPTGMTNFASIMKQFQNNMLKSKEQAANTSKKTEGEDKKSNN